MNINWHCTILFIWLIGPVANAQPNFVRVTDTVLTADSFSGAGAAWADYDGDGWLDLAQANYDGASYLFHNNGDGTFTKVTTNGVAFAGAETYGVSWGDYNNDGRPDLFFGKGYESGFQSLLFRNQTLTNGGFARVTTAPGSLTGHSLGCAWADYDRDGFLDLFVANSDEPSYLWHNKGDGTFQRVVTGPVVTKVGNSIGAAWADYDNDGWPDLLVANGFNETGKLFLYHNNHDGTFTQVVEGDIVGPTEGFTGIAWGDYDNDGFLDVFVTVSNGHNYLYHNNGDGTFTGVIEGDIVSDFGTFISTGWADYDNDGWLDLFVGNRAQDQPSLLYHNNGDGTFTKITEGPIVEDIAPNGGCAWGDYDGDGFPDLFASVFNIWGDAMPSVLYHNEGTTNHWLKVVPHATRSNAGAIGAKVRLTAMVNGTAITQMREISTGDGLAGNSPEALFGLGDTNNAMSISIEWPSGETNRSPVSVSQGVKEIWESQPLSLAVVDVSARTNSQGENVTVRLIGGDPNDYSTGIAAGEVTSAHRGYAIETSYDLLHWTRYGDESTDFLSWPGSTAASEYVLSLDTTTGDGSATNHGWFLRARDVGFVSRTGPRP